MRHVASQTLLNNLDREVVRFRGGARNFSGGAMTKSKGVGAIREGRTINFTNFRMFLHRNIGLYEKNFHLGGRALLVPVSATG
jgi:hypothetical protein